MQNLALTLTTITLLALPAIAQERGQKRDQPERNKGDLENVEKRIKSAVARGVISKEEAKAKFAEMKKMMEKKRNAEQKSGKPSFESIERRLKEGVKRGDITEEQAKARFAEAKKMRRELELKHRESADRKRNEQADHQKRREHEERIRREQQERRMHEEREHKQDREHEERGHHEHDHTERQLDEAREHAERQRERHHHARFDAIEKSLQQAVEAGLISGLEAQKTMAKIHLAAIKHQQKKERR